MTNAELRERLLVLLADGRSRYRTLVAMGPVTFCHTNCAMAELERMVADGLVRAEGPPDDDPPPHYPRWFSLTPLGEDAAREALVPQCID